MTIPKAEVARVAASLTKAQVKRLVGIFELRARGLSWASRYGSLSIRTSRATTAVLRERLLIYDGIGNAALTDLGLAVVAHLQQSTERGE